MAISFSKKQRSAWTALAAAGTLTAAAKTRKKMSDAIDAGQEGNFDPTEIFDPAWWEDDLEEHAAPALAIVASQSAAQFADKANLSLVGLAISAGLSFVVASQISNLSGHAGKTGERVLDLVDQANIEGWTKEKLNEELGTDGSTGQLSDGIAESMGETTALSTYGGAAEEVIDAAGLVGTKMWVCTFDNSRQDHEDADGQTVGVDEAFDIGGFPAMFPGDPDLPDDQLINCNCTMEYSVEQNPDNTEEFSVREFGGDGSGRQPGGETKNIVAMRGHLDKIDELLATPLYDPYAEAVGGPGSESQKDAWSGANGALMVSMAGAGSYGSAAIIPGPALVEAEALTREVGQMIVKEVDYRLSHSDPPIANAFKLEQKVDRIRAQLAKPSKEMNAAKKDAVNQMVTERFGSVESARAQLGEKDYKTLEKDLVRIADPRYGRTKGDRFVPGLEAFAPGDKEAYKWSFDPKDLDKADDAAAVDRANLREAETAAAAARVEWNRAAAGVIDQIRGTPANKETGEPAVPGMNPPGNDLKVQQYSGEFRSGAVTLEGDQDFVRESWDKATRNLPKDWVDLGNEEPPIVAMSMDSRVRAYCAGREIQISSRTETPVMAHELTHRLQNQDRKWLATDQAFIARRTAEGGYPPPGTQQSLEKLSVLVPGAAYSDHEVSRGDDFVNAYIGKDYPQKADGLPVGTEVSSMAIEAWKSGTLVGSRGAKTGKVDKDWVHYTLGTLASAGKNETGRQVRSAMRK